MKKLLYILPILALTYGCTKKVDSNDLKDDVPYYQGYEVSYNKTDNSVLAVAWYMVRSTSGAKVELSGNANVRANGLTPGTSSIDKTRYTWTINGNPDVEFVLTKGSGAKITNKVNKSDLGDMDFASSFPANVSKSSGFTFSWTGTPLASNESMSATLSYPLGTTIATKEVTGNTVTFSAADMVNCPLGEAHVELYRVKDIPVKTDDGGAGGNIQLRRNTMRKVTVN
jgi:hypothetical protein